VEADAHELRPLAWWFEIGGTRALRIWIPFWTITLPTIALTVFAWRRDAAARRRALHNHCPACGYDRAGLAANSVCPECGGVAESNAGV